MTDEMTGGKQVVGRTLRTGRKVDGFTMLKNHIEDWHPREAEEMEAVLGPSDEGEDCDDE